MYTQKDPVRQPLDTMSLLVNALNQDPGRPLLHLLDGQTLNVGEVRDATSRYVQALATLGVVEGTRVGLLSSNSPEVLHASHAAKILGAIYIPCTRWGHSPIT
jgi:fatty-acyl-CoA synthase